MNIVKEKPNHKKKIHFIAALYKLQRILKCCSPLESVKNLEVENYRVLRPIYIQHTDLLSAGAAVYLAKIPHQNKFSAKKLSTIVDDFGLRSPIHPSPMVT